MIGKIISNYKIIEKLGEGGMGVVYKAHDNSLDRDIVLKFLPHYLITQPNEKERFYHEARAAAAIMHPNVAVVYGIGEHENQVYISIEYIEGKTLKQIIEKDSESLTIVKTLDNAIQICEGLTAAHEKGIVHRDIKSDNIMVTSKGRIKIMDFGLAKIKGATRLTQSGSTVGTAAYMSPEQAKGEEVDHRSDLFSFGVVLYEMLTSHLPFKGEYQAALLYSILNDDPQPIARYNDKVPPELEHLVNKALAKDKNERYQHADDLLADLKTVRKKLEYAQSGYIKSSSITQQNIKSNSDSRRNRSKFFISVSVVIILAMIIFYFNPFNFQLLDNPSSERTLKSLAVMYFENIPDPTDKEHTGEMITNLLITSLSQVKGLEVISRERLLDIQKDLGQPDTKILSSSLASKIANRAGVNTILVGSILKDNPRLAVTTRLIDVKTGKIISSNQVLNYDSDKIFNLVDSLSLLIQNNFRNVIISKNEIKPIAEVTTNSPEAYRAYLEGLELSNKFYSLEAASAFSKAVELDSTFAMAYFRLAHAQLTSGYLKSAYNSFQKAIILADNASECERLQILATNYVFQNKLNEAIEILEEVLKNYPHEYIPYILFINIYNLKLLQPVKAIEKLLYGIKKNPTDKLLLNSLAYSYATLNKRSEAFNTIKKYISLAPAEPNPYDTQGDLYVWFKNYDSSIISYQKSLSLRKDFASAEKLGCFAVLNKNYNDASEYFQMSGYKVPVIKIHKGQINKALKENKDMPDYCGIMLFYEIGEYSKMLKLSQKHSIDLKNNPFNNIYGRGNIVWALAKKGNFSEAYKLLNKIEDDVAGTNTRLQLIVKYYSALILFEEGKFDPALKQFKEVFDSLPPNHEPNIFYAICLLKCGQIPNAINEFALLTKWPASDELYIIDELPGGSSYWPIPAVKAHYWLGAAYEKLGEKEKALKEYEEFLDIWKDADFNPVEIKDAKDRVTQIREITLK